VRASSYIIYVDLPNTAEEMLLVHGYSGAYDRVSSKVANYVRSLELRQAPKPLYGVWSSEPAIDQPVQPPSDATVETLRRRGYLTNLTFEEEEEVLKTVVHKLHRQNSQKPAYLFMPTYDCNLRCSYCFQHHMRTDPKYGHLLKMMSRETVDRIFRGMTSIETLHGLEPKDVLRRDIGFFGGEPLLAQTRPIIDYIMEKTLASGEGSFWAVTNATELQAYEDLLGPQRLGRIQVTLDGPPAAHDRRRIYADGSGSFEKIARNINLALDRGVEVSVRLNIDRRNLMELPELAEIMHRQGWTQYRNFGVYTAPVEVTNENMRREEEMDSWALDNAIAELQKEHPLMSIVAQPDDSLRRQARSLFHDAEHTPIHLKESFCSAHTGMYIFDSFADMYACWERTGEPSVRIGHVNEDGSIAMNSPMLQIWRSRTVASNPVCSKCRYALNCGGGCAVRAQGRTGEMHTNFCDGYSSRFRAKVAQAYLEHLAGQEMPVGLNRVCDQ